MQIAPNLIESTHWLDDRQDEMLALIRLLCDQNSGTFNLAGIEAVGELLLNAYQPLQATVTRLLTDSMESIDDAGNVVTTKLGEALLLEKRPELPTQVILCIHMDTVYGIDHPFQKCQMLDSQTMNGPGVIDAKGGLVVMLYGLREFEQSSLSKFIGWKVLINPDEEIGSPGSSRIITELAGKAKLGLLFEPALPSGELVSWRRGSGAFTFVVRGRSAHAGRDFTAGRNAIAALSRLLVAIHDLNTSPEITYNVGRISGGGALNIVPDLAIGRVNVRVKTVEQQAEAETAMCDLIDGFNKSLDGIAIEMSGSFTSPPKTVSAETELLMKRIDACAAALGMTSIWAGSGGASDGNKFAKANLPNIDSLGPEGGEIHSSREFLKIQSLVPKAKLTALILQTIAQENMA